MIIIKIITLLLLLVMVHRVVIQEICLRQIKLNGKMINILLKNV